MKFNQQYVAMIVAQTGAVGNADFRDVVLMCCGR